MKRYAVVVHHDRHEWCMNLVRQLIAQHTTVVVVDNNSTPPLTYPEDLADSDDLFMFEFEPEPFNLATLWNVGLNMAERIHQARGGGEWIVGVFNDDLSIPMSFMDQCEHALIHYGAAVAYPDQNGYGANLLNDYAPSPVTDHSTKMTGFAHVTFGHLGLRFDESFPVWYGDNDYEMQARLNGGTVLVGGLRVEHLDANGNFSRNPEWQEQAGLDRETFRAKWGFDAW